MLGEFRSPTDHRSPFAICCYVDEPRTWIPGELVTSGMMNTIRDLFLEIEAGTAQMIKATLVGDTTTNIATLISDSGEAALAYDTTLGALVASLNAGAFGKFYAPYEIVALTDGATPALDASLGMIGVGVFRLAAAGNRTIAVPSNPSAGRRIIIAHFASGGARTLALNTGAGGFRFGEDITGLTATTSGKTDYIGAIYNNTDSKFDVVAYAKGY